METRKIQLTGGSTYTVSLPKEWAKDNGISAGSEVALYPEEGSLFVTPTNGKATAKGSRDVSGLDSDELTRAAIAMYVGGFDTIVLETGRTTPEQRQAIRTATETLVGVEIVEEDGERVILRDLLDARELSISKGLSRIRVIALSMLADAVEALLANDPALARDVIRRDDDVDRLWLAIARNFRATLRSPRAMADVQLPQEVCFDYHTCARQLERVADHAAKIAELSLDLETVPEAGRTAIAELHETAAGVVETSMDALFAEDRHHARRLANQAREESLALDDAVRDLNELLREFPPRQAQVLSLVADSLSRCADYGGNVAETALLRAGPRPSDAGTTTSH